MIPIMLILGWIILITVTVWFIVSEIKRHKRRREDAFYKWLDDTATKVSGNIALELTFAILGAYIVLSFLTYANWEKFL